MKARFSDNFKTGLNSTGTVNLIIIFQVLQIFLNLSCLKQNGKLERLHGLRNLCKILLGE
jgi:hypothetical protein